jgi:hypothetical protein
VVSPGLIFGDKLPEQHLSLQKIASISTQIPLPHKAIKWLKKYGLTDKEISENKFSWDGLSRLVYPVQGLGGICAYERRDISGNSPKTILQGTKAGSFHLIIPEKEEFKGVIAVEDIISAIKVGRLAKTLCLFGSHCSTIQYHEVSLATDLLILWLDHDKFKESVKITHKAQSFGLQTRVIKTDLDPKMYSTFEIRKIINDS